ncbi:regulator [Halobacteriales archaeon QS_7_69_60]|nr:MAG: regulator [Halobacteriales archaeon QS_7_69_60]
MSVETPADPDRTDDVDELASELGEAITDLPVYGARQAGDATNEDLRELQRTQQELHEKPKMAAYLQAQSELELKLQELDELVSEPLAVDFGQTAGGCCED